MQMRSRLAVPLLLAALASAAISADLPRKAPEWKIEMNSGKPVLLSQYRGKAVILAFILTACPHCQHTTGLLVKDQAEYGPKGLQVLECAINDGARNLVPNFIQTYKTNFPVGFVDDQAGLGEFVDLPPSPIPQMPILMFIDRNGMIRSVHQGSGPLLGSEKQEQNLRDEIEKLLKIPATHVAAKGAAKKK
jgi:peroxiredoxin